MKKQIKKLLTIDLFRWPIALSLGTLSRFYANLHNARVWEQNSAERKPPDAELLRRVENALEFFSGYVVRNGPFKGMQYPDKKAFCSTFFPKIIGSYEKEISEAITYATSQPYSAIVDVGCAEGYYAVGLGMRTTAKVFAFDTNPVALDACREMGRINGVEINTGGFCDKATLLSL